jgi:hypothetical protein
MRERKEIIANLSKQRDTGINGGSNSEPIIDNQKLILEVLLDIRDLLTNANPQA